MKPPVYWNVENGTLMIHDYALWAILAMFCLSFLALMGLLIAIAV